MAWLTRTGLLVRISHALPGRGQTVEGFAHAGVEGGEIQIVLAVVLEKILERFLNFRFCRLVAQGAVDQHRGAVCRRRNRRARYRAPAIPHMLARWR